MKKLSREININGRLIAEDSPPYVNAEISANQNGNVAELQSWMLVFRLSTQNNTTRIGVACCQCG